MVEPANGTGWGLSLGCGVLFALGACGGPAKQTPAEPMPQGTEPSLGDGGGRAAGDSKGGSASQLPASGGTGGRPETPALGGQFGGANDPVAPAPENAGGNAGGAAGAGGSADGAAEGPNLQSPVRYKGGAWAMDLVVADLNGDGALDVASADFSSSIGGVYVWLNRGDGTFATGAPYLRGEHSSWITAGDFNDDRKIDLLVAREKDGLVVDLALLANAGDGSFSSAASVTSGESSTSVWGLRALHADADGKLDFIAGSTLYVNRGDGQFVASAGPATGQPSVITDFNGDGKMDIVGTLAVGLSSGASSFETVPFSTGRSSPSTVRGAAVGDANRDGLLDIVVAHDHEANASIVLNQGDGTFSQPTLYPSGSWPTDVALGDLDGDEWPELVVANSGIGTSASRRPNYLGVYHNRGDGTFETPEQFLNVEFPYVVELADVDGNGGLDIVVASGGDLVVVRGNAR